MLKFRKHKGRSLCYRRISYRHTHLLSAVAGCLHYRQNISRLCHGCVTQREERTQHRTLYSAEGKALRYTGNCHRYVYLRNATGGCSLRGFALFKVCEGDLGYGRHSRLRSFYV